MADKRHFVLVISPAYVKPILDGSKCVIIYPGADQEKLEEMRAAAEDLKGKPDLSVLSIKPDSLDVEWVELKRLREIRGE